MAEHTPGPWRVGRGAQADPFAIEAAALTVAHVKTTPNAEANADLIAAAPDLLAALKEIIAINDEPLGIFRKRGGTRRGLSTVVAEAAIAKAEGR